MNPQHILQLTEANDNGSTTRETSVKQWDTHPKLKQPAKVPIYIAYIHRIHIYINVYI